MSARSIARKIFCGKKGEKTMPKIVGVRFKPVGKIYHFSPGNLAVKIGDDVIVETSRGVEFGRVVLGERDIAPDPSRPLKDIIRIANHQDYENQSANKQKEKEAFSICLEKIKDHGLEMKLVDVEYTFDGNKILFYFTADGRVDFRELVRDLATVFHTRIELRQIGVRDEAKTVGSIGVCGRGLCCSQFLGDFEPVSIKMAKEQGMSLNPTKISGTCGRLMCCLKYEQDTYEQLIKTLPRQGSIVKTPAGEGIVENVNLFKGILRIRIDGGEKVMRDFHVSEIKVIKHARPPKNDDDYHDNDDYIK